MNQFVKDADIALTTVDACVHIVANLPVVNVA
jgi:hypothetical protein